MHAQRHRGLDIAKVCAAVLVLILHVNAYTMLLNSDSFSLGCRYTYYISEAIAYPAIHLFVLAGSWIMLDRGGISIKSLTSIWIQTVTVCLLGLTLMCALQPSSINLIGLLRCFFPLTFRAYWYVSTYVLLMLLSPILILLIRAFNKKQLYIATLIVNMISSLPSLFPKLGWDVGRLGLFISLFFIAACIKESKILSVDPSCFIYCGLLCVAFLSICAILLDKLSNTYPIFDGKEMLFYQYNSPVVVLYAVCLFCLFARSESWNGNLTSLALKSVDCTLAVYLLQMHPIIKEQYTSWGIMSFMHTDNVLIYTIQLILVATIAYLVLVTFGKILLFIVRIPSAILSNILTKMKCIKVYCSSFGIQ